jgi:hypothetical protein
MTEEDAAAEIDWVDSGAVFSVCSGPPGWYEANWCEPTVRRAAKACNVDFGYDSALALLIKARVEVGHQ